MQLNEQQIKDFFDACYQYDEHRIVEYLQQGYDPFEWQEEYHDFIYNILLEDVLDIEETGEQYKLALLPKLTQLFCDNGLDFVKINKYVGDGSHPTPFWMMSFLDVTPELRQTLEIMIEHGMTVDEGLEMIEHNIEDIIYLYDPSDYGTPNSDEFHVCMLEMLWLGIFPPYTCSRRVFEELYRI